MPSENLPLSVARDDFSVQVALRGDALLETYTIGPAFNRSVPRHIHETYQLQWSTDSPCFHHYRGASEILPPRRLSVIHPGEAHGSPPLPPREETARFHVLYLPLEMLSPPRKRVGDGIPFLKYCLTRPDLTPLLDALSSAMRSRRNPLMGDVLLESLREILFQEAGAAAEERRGPPEKKAIGQALDYLHANVAEPVTLTALAQVAGQEPSSLCRRFRQVVGLPPHQYQNALRLEQAKTALRRGVPLGEVAASAGFAHQSHFGMHFKRLVGVTPGAYASALR